MTGASVGLNELAVALAKAQAELQNIGADAKGHVGREGTFGRDYKYLSLAKLLDHVRPILANHGLAIVQTCEPSEPDSVRLSTTLLHTSGQWITGTALIPLGNNTPQGYGSAMTYARRYSLQAMIGVAADEDDDGAAAKPPRRIRRAPEPPPQPSLPPPEFFGLKIAALNTNADARKRFFATLSGDFGWSHEQALAKLGIDSFSRDVPDKTVREVLNTCQLIYASERN